MLLPEGCFSAGSYQLDTRDPELQKASVGDLPTWNILRSTICMEMYEMHGACLTVHNLHQ